MGVREENKEKMELHIYDVAIDLFCEIGFKKTTLVDIASAAQVSTRTLHKYFPTKESILRRFCTENILALRAFASGLPAEMPLKEKVIATMVNDFSLMFCLFDTSYILHSARDETGFYARFELENVLATEATYCTMFRQAQLAYGIEQNKSAEVCASVVVSIYRHCTDLYRFHKKDISNEEELKNFYAMHLDLVWPSIEQGLFGVGTAV